MYIMLTHIAPITRIWATKQSDNLHPLRLAVERDKYPNYQNFCSAGNMLTHEIRVKINLANRLW